MIMLCDATGDATGDATWRCYLEDFNLLSSTCCKTEAARSVVFERTSYLPLSRLSAVQSMYNSLIPVDTNAYICSVAPCLRVLTVALLPLFPLFFSFRLMQPDVGAQEPDATAGAYYYVETTDDHE